MKLLNCLKPVMLGLVVAWLAAGCATTRTKPEVAPAAAVAESAITAAEMAAVLEPWPYDMPQAETVPEPEPKMSSNEGAGKSGIETAIQSTDFTGRNLTPGDALHIAAAKNPNFAEYAAAREAALAEVMAATAWKNPSLEAGVGRGKTRGTPSTSGFEYSLGLIQPIEWPGKRGVRKEAAEAGVKVAELDEALFRSTLRADVLRAYWTAVYCDDDHLLGRSLAEIAVKECRLMEALRAGGEVPDAGMLPFRREASRLEQERVKLAGELDMALLLFNKLCGMTVPRVSPWFQFDALDMAVPGVHDKTAARELAQRKHPAILKLEAERRRAELVVKQSELAKKPDFTPGLEASRGVDVTSWGARLGMELPFWNRNKAGIAAAKAELRRVEAQLAVKRQEVEAGVTMAVLALESAREQLPNARSGADIADLAFEAAQKAFDGGETNQSAVLAARRELGFAARILWRSTLEVVLARIQLEQAIGYGEMK